MPAFRILAAPKRLRGGTFDIFGYSEERRKERRLIGEYETTIDYDPGDAQPEQPRDGGADRRHAGNDARLRPRKEKNVKAAKEREASLLAAYKSPATCSIAAE